MISPKKFRELQDQVSSLEYMVQKQSEMLSKVISDHNNLTDALVRKTLLKLQSMENNSNTVVQNIIIAAAEAAGDEIIYEEDLPKSETGQ